MNPDFPNVNLTTEEADALPVGRWFTHVRTPTTVCLRTAQGWFGAMTLDTLPNAQWIVAMFNQRNVWPHERPARFLAQDGVVVQL